MTHTPEPWCNHDAVAVVNGVCECGWRVGTPADTICLSAADLSGIRAWASVLEASLRDDTRTDRIRDDAHDLVMTVASLLYRFGSDVIWNDADAADRALADYLIG